MEKFDSCEHAGDIISFEEEDNVNYSDKNIFDIDFEKDERKDERKDEGKDEESKNESKVIYFIYPTKSPNEEKFNGYTQHNDLGTKANTKSSSKKPFYIMKVNKKHGRIRKEWKGSIKGKHNKFSKDNIIKKIKTSFHNKIVNYVNYEYKNYRLKGKNYNSQKQINNVKLIKKISPKEITKIKKEDNLNWFSLKLKVLLSSNLSSKYTKFKLNYNENRIKNLSQKKEVFKVIDVLEKTVKDMYEIYINNIKIDGFGTLEDDLIALREKMEKNGEEEIKTYLNKYEKIAKNLDKFLYQKE